MSLRRPRTPTHPRRTLACGGLAVGCGRLAAFPEATGHNPGLGACGPDPLAVAWGKPLLFEPQLLQGARGRDTGVVLSRPWQVDEGWGLAQTLVPRPHSRSQTSASGGGTQTSAFTKQTNNNPGTPLWSESETLTSHAGPCPYTVLTQRRPIPAHSSRKHREEASPQTLWRKLRHV